MVVSLQNGVDNVERIRAAAALDPSQRWSTSRARCPRQGASSTLVAAIFWLEVCPPRRQTGRADTGQSGARRAREVARSAIRTGGCVTLKQRSLCGFAVAAAARVHHHDRATCAAACAALRSAARAANTRWRPRRRATRAAAYAGNTEAVSAGLSRSPQESGRRRVADDSPHV